MEPQTKEQASKDEEFDFWSFQAHERGVGETIKSNYCRSESLEREGIFVQEAIIEPKKSQIEYIQRNNTLSKLERILVSEEKQLKRNNSQTPGLHIKFDIFIVA
jgi:hypothetical protein